MNKKILIPTFAIAALAVASAVGLNIAHAEDTNTYPPLVQKLAERFGLNQSDVQSVFDEERADHHAQMQQNINDRLSQAVADGVLTEDQKNALIQKFEEKQNEREQNHEEMQTWLKDQGIDMSKLGSYIGFGGHGMGHWHMMGN